MARCENCLHCEICDIMHDQYGIGKIYSIQCEHYLNAGNVAPRAEIEREIGEEIYRIIGDAYNDTWVCLLVQKLADKLTKENENG